MSSQFIDFRKKDFNLRASLGLYFNLVKELGNSSKNFIIGDEPNKQLIKNHNYWNEIRTINNIEVLPTTEIDKVEEYINIHNVQKIPSIL